MAGLTFNYDQMNRLTEMSTPVSSYTYTLGPTGNRTKAVESNHSRTVIWSYDDIYRLTGESINSDEPQNSGSASYGLDPVGNRTSVSSNFSGFSPIAGVYNADDQISSETYDLDGNVLATGSNTYAYDSENRMTSANNGAVRLIYDGDGNRVAKIVGSVTTQYLIDDLNPTGLPQVVEEVVNGAVTRQYTYGLQRISQTQIIDNQWVTSYYGYDGAWNVRQLTNASGVVTDTYDYDAFGNVINKTGTTPNNYLYRGEQFDPDLGMYYLRARWYNPNIGRFISRDPENGFTTDPKTLHKYAYANGDPANVIDPTGRLGQVGVLQRPGAGGGAIGDYVTLALMVTTVAVLELPQVREAVACQLLWDATDSLAWVEYGIDYGRGMDPWIEKIGNCEAKEESKCRKGDHNHHMLPQQFRQRFAECGIPNIDEPEFMRCVPSRCHTGTGGLHSNQNGPGTNWNARWNQFLGPVGTPCPEGGEQAIVNFMLQLAQDFLQQFLCPE